MPSFIAVIISGITFFYFFFCFPFAFSFRILLGTDRLMSMEHSWSTYGLWQHSNEAGKQDNITDGILYKCDGFIFLASF